MSRLGSREFWVPGRRQGAIFLLIVFLGLGAWALKEAVFRPVAGADDLSSLLALAIGTGVALYAVLALGSGFLAPRGFYLWGIAVVLSHPFVALDLTANRQSRGFELVLGGTEGWVNYALVLVVTSFATAVLLTALSTVGAALRILLDHLRRGRPGTVPRDVRSR